VWARDGGGDGFRAVAGGKGGELLPRLMTWRGEKNVYRNVRSLLALRQLMDPSDPKKGIDDGPLPGFRTLADWQRVWKASEIGSVQGEIRFEGGDVLTKMQTSPERMTAADFRLRPDSPGYRAGKDGKDLGADVDLVGPGVAYERWKKKPEYQQWLKETGQKK